jgi:hypothetical protein
MYHLFLSKNIFLIPIPNNNKIEIPSIINNISVIILNVLNFNPKIEHNPINSIKITI